MRTAPRQGGEGRQDEREGIARHGWLTALPHHLKEEDEDEAGRMSDRRGAAILLVDRRRGVAMWWRLHRPELDEVAARPSP